MPEYQGVNKPTVERKRNMSGTMVAMVLGCVLLATAVQAKEHPGKEQILKDGYKGPVTCEECHPGKAKEFLGKVHWKHASKVDHVDNINPAEEYGMKNRIYTMCNGNDIVNNLKEVPTTALGKSTFTGCNTR